MSGGGKAAQQAEREYQAWWDSISGDKAKAMPYIDLEDHALVYKLVWSSALGVLPIAVQKVRASMGIGEAPDPALLADPTLTPDNMLAAMQASMAAGF